MILKLFGLLDLLAGIVLILLKWSIGINLGWFLAVYLIIKALIFFSIIASVLDFASAVFIILAINGTYLNVTWVFVLWLSQKGLVSLFS